MILWKPSNRRKIGNFGEDLARSHLVRAGFSIVEANWTARSAEIDLIARSGNRTLWFFEVRFRQSALSGTAAESFTPKKRHDFLRAISFYCLKHRIDPDTVRAGLIAIDRKMDGYRIMRYSEV